MGEDQDPWKTERISVVVARCSKIIRRRIMKGVTRCSANYIALSPVSFLERAALVFGDNTSIVYGSLRFSWKQTHRRSLKLASALIHLGISRHDVVAAIAPNIPALYEIHFAVPMAGAVLSALNFRLDVTMLALILQQLEPKFIVVDHQFVDLVLKALDVALTQTCTNCTATTSGNLKWPTIILIPEYSSASSSTSNGQGQHRNFIHQNLPEGSLNYNDLVESADDDDDDDVEFEMVRPNDECDPISVNYTSGSTGNPKGVVYSHRAVYLNSVATILNINMDTNQRCPVFLWTVDMFRCNGWCYTWAMAALGATNVCLPSASTVSADVIFDAITLHKVTHLCGKPVILNILADAYSWRKPLQSRVDIVVAGSLPSPQVVTKVMEMGFNVSHGYGMTEALGPAIIETLRPETQQLQQCNKHYNSDHGVVRRLITMEGYDVKDSKTMESVPSDGKTIGEIMFRGNTLMSGYLKSTKASEAAFRGGWYRTGDVGIKHPDGYIQMKDRAEDIVICGGRPISTLELEALLLTHPSVSEAAVVGRLHHCLGETPCAFVNLKDSEVMTSDQEIIDFCGNNLPAYMVPTHVIFGDLPVNSTGKVQKFVLRDKANAIGRYYIEIM